MQTKSISCLSIRGGWALCQEAITELARTVHWTVRLVRTLLAERPSAPIRPTARLTDAPHFAPCDSNRQKARYFFFPAIRPARRNAMYTT